MGQVQAHGKEVRAMKLYMVRHGETHHNVQRLHQGHYNSSLTPKGIKQAQLIGERLKEESFDILYSSDLERAMMTASEIAKHHPGLVWIRTEQMREQAKGIYENQPYGVDPEEQKRQNVPWYWFKPPGGESLADVWDKIVGFYEGLKMKHENDKVLLVSHGGPLLCLIMHLNGNAIDDIGSYKFLDNTSLSIYEPDESGKHRISLYNCTKHLENLAE
ncbi:MAG: histidine phosphatase family protein [Candidatus Woesearchaeota archaeon]